MTGQLIVRNLEDEVVEALRKRAARHGRSAEAEHRLILRAALLKPPAEPKLSLKELILAIPKADSNVRHGLALKRRKDPSAVAKLAAWIDQIETVHRDRILKIDKRVARLWAELGVPDALPPIDGLLASTALLHDLTLVTRNT